MEPLQVLALFVLLYALNIQAFEFPWCLSDKESACNKGDMGLILVSGRSPGEENGSPLQYSFLGNPMDRGAWWARVHEMAKELDTT